jgi:prepilin-type N-terminal cleavage/methylation domain-containing protein
MKNRTIISKTGFTLVELLITLTILSVIIGIFVATWVHTFREIQTQYLLNSAAEGVLFVLSDARGRSIREGKTYRVTTIDYATDVGTATAFVAGIREIKDSKNYLLARTRWELTKSSQSAWGKPILFDISFEPEGKYYYVFGAWVEESTNTTAQYTLITKPTTITISLVDDAAYNRQVVVEKGFPKEVVQ